MKKRTKELKGPFLPRTPPTPKPIYGNGGFREGTTWNDRRRLPLIKERLLFHMPLEGEGLCVDSEPQGKRK